MQLMDFVDACGLRTKKEIEVFELLCYYQFKEKGERSFSVKNMVNVYQDAGIPVPDKQEMKKEAKKCGSFRPQGIEGTLKFGKDALRSLEKTYGHFWRSASTESVKEAVLTPAEFAVACELDKKTDIEKFELFCYYMQKETGVVSFSVKNIIEMLADGDSPPEDAAALEKQAKRHPSFRLHGIGGGIEFIQDVYKKMDRTYGHLWAEASENKIEQPQAAGVGMLDERIFCGKREGVDRLVVQINRSYRNEDYDACAAVMRRLLGSMLILSFHAEGIEKEIFADGRYVPIEEMIQKAGNTGLLAPGVKDDLAAVSGIGDYSERGATYTYGANDVNSLRNAYRNVLEALFSASKLT